MNAHPEPLALYDGRFVIGCIQPRGPRFEAVLEDGRSLGLFNNPRAAASAISHAVNCHRCDPRATA